MISINKSEVPYEKLMEASRTDVPIINELAHEWKIWIENKEEGLIGGIYYFEDEEAFKKSSKELKPQGALPPLVENVSNYIFDVNVDLSKLTKAPI